MKIPETEQILGVVEEANARRFPFGDIQRRRRFQTAFNVLEMMLRWISDVPSPIR